MLDNLDNLDDQYIDNIIDDDLFKYPMDNNTTGFDKLKIFR